jgi:1-acyl-sn-glycerol-3-phosphate acyltransferase
MPIITEEAAPRIAVSPLSGADTASLLRKERLINRFARVTQFISWPLFFVLFHVLFDVRTTGRANFRAVKSPFIVIANHISFYDSFLFRLILGFATPHLPLRFMGVTNFNWRFLNFLSSIGVVDFIYGLFGVFTIVPGRGIERNLEEAREIIRAGGNIVIYPEGKIVIEHGVAPFKKGAAVLQLETGVSVIPVSFNEKRNWLRRQISINIGGPMSMLDGRSVEEVTESFHAAISELYGRK